MTAGQRFARLVTDDRRPRAGAVAGLPRPHAAELRPARAGVGRDARQPGAAPARSPPRSTRCRRRPSARSTSAPGPARVARLAAERWPAAEVTGVDVSRGDGRGGATCSTTASATRSADASALPFPDGAFDLVTLNNMIPFFDELARVVAPGGHVAIALRSAPATPIWVPLERVRDELEQRGFAARCGLLGRPASRSLPARPNGRRVPATETFATRYHRSGRLFSCGYTSPRGEVAQLVEHTAENRGVAGSSPALAIQ